MIVDVAGLELFDFQVEQRPAVQGNHRVGRQGQIYEASSAALRVWRDSIGWEARRAMGRRAPAVGPVLLEVWFRLKTPARLATDWPHHRPDVDKLSRAVLDALTGIAYLDDAQVVGLAAWKVCGTPGARIRCSLLEGVA